MTGYHFEICMNVRPLFHEMQEQVRERMVFFCAKPAKRVLHGLTKLLQNFIFTWIFSLYDVKYLYLKYT